MPPPLVRPIEDLLNGELRAKRSILEPFSAEILRAVAAGASYSKIAEWLQVNGVRVSRQSLNEWVLRRQKRLANRAELARTTTDQEMGPPASSNQTPAPVLQAPQQSAAESAGKFNAATAKLGEKPKSLVADLLSDESKAASENPLLKK